MKRPLSSLVLALAMATLAAVPAAAEEQWRSWPIERVSVNEAGEQALGWSTRPQVTPDGRFVVFQSGAPNLVPGTENGFDDIFVVDRTDGTVDRASVATDGTEGDHNSWYPSISDDGRYVVFASVASTLVPGKQHDLFDVYLRDRAEGTTVRVNTAPSGEAGNAISLTSSISGDGRYVAFASQATNLVEQATSPGFDVYVYQVATAEIELASVTADGSPGNVASFNPSISRDGRYVAFQSAASNLVPGTANFVTDIYVRDMHTGEIERASLGPGDAESHWHSLEPRLTPDGRYVAFRSEATNLVPHDRNPRWDVFVRDREAGRTERVSVSSRGVDGEGQQTFFSISDDGRYVAFQSAARNLVPGVDNSRADVFVHDRETRATERVSYTSDGREPDHNSVSPALTADGRTVVFSSYARNMVPDKTNMTADVYAHERGPRLGVDALHVEREAGSVAVSGRASVASELLASATSATGPGTLERMLGGDLRRASLVVRPLQGDVLARLELAELPGFRGDGLAGAFYCDLFGCPQSVGGLPTVRYAVAFDVDGDTYEARAERVLEDGSPFVTDPRFSLHRCADGVCDEVGAVEGSVGGTGEEVLLAIPFDTLDLRGRTATGLQAVVSGVDPVTGEAARWDEIGLADVAVPDSVLRLGVAPASTPPDQVVFDTVVAYTGHWFQASLAAGDPGEDAAVFVQACRGEACATASEPLPQPGA